MIGAALLGVSNLTAPRTPKYSSQARATRPAAYRLAPAAHLAATRRPHTLPAAAHCTLPPARFTVAARYPRHSPSPLAVSRWVPPLAARRPPAARFTYTHTRRMRTLPVARYMRLLPKKCKPLHASTNCSARRSPLPLATRRLRVAQNPAPAPGQPSPAPHVKFATRPARRPLPPGARCSGRSLRLATRSLSPPPAACCPLPATSDAFMPPPARRTRSSRNSLRVRARRQERALCTRARLARPAVHQPLLAIYRGLTDVRRPTPDALCRSSLNTDADGRRRRGTSPAQNTLDSVVLAGARSPCCVDEISPPYGPRHARHMPRAGRHPLPARCPPAARHWLPVVPSSAALTSVWQREYVETTGIQTSLRHLLDLLVRLRACIPCSPPALVTHKIRCLLATPTRTRTRWLLHAHASPRFAQGPRSTPAAGRGPFLVPHSRCSLPIPRQLSPSTPASRKSRGPPPHASLVPPLAVRHLPLAAPGRARTVLPATCASRCPHASPCPLAACCRPRARSSRCPHPTVRRPPPLLARFLLPASSSARCTHPHHATHRSLPAVAVARLRLPAPHCRCSLLAAARLPLGACRRSLFFAGSPLSAALPDARPLPLHCTHGARGTPHLMLPKDELGSRRRWTGSPWRRQGRATEPAPPPRGAVRHLSPSMLRSPRSTAADLACDSRPPPAARRLPPAAVADVAPPAAMRVSCRALLPLAVTPGKEAVNGRQRSQMTPCIRRTSTLRGNARGSCISSMDIDARFPPHTGRRTPIDQALRRPGRLGSCRLQRACAKHTAPPRPRHADHTMRMLWTPPPDSQHTPASHGSTSSVTPRSLCTVPVHAARVGPDPLFVD
ncbi:hypothetical protein GGX14DRAFT_569631 [Mycena pura]|uniref:Uncharacterized protein n=1 Tax=Mycena pura TaxID=153505 RepID=A0AAD6VDH7_9AGAR|nr:hypothetical protein GGX14DRAFT_569631 [Mycena pura]